jgi:hypothetical protein
MINKRQFMNFSVFVKYLFLIAIINNTSFALTKSEINARLDNYKKYLGCFPPTINSNKDSVKHELNGFIDTVIQNKSELNDDYFYYTALGDAYSFAYNLDISNSWEDCFDNYWKAIEINSRGFEPRYRLAVHFLNSYKSKESYKLGYEFAYKLLSSLVEDKLADKHPEVYWTFTLFYAGVGKIEKATENAYSYSRLVNYDSTSKKLLELSYGLSGECVRYNNKNEYENYCVGYKLKYPDKIFINSDMPFSLNNSPISIIHFSTPKAIDINSDSIINDICIITYPSTNIADSILNTFIKRGQKYLSEGRKTKCKLTSVSKCFYTDKNYGNLKLKEGFKGITTIVATGNYNYVLIYMATESTYSTNYKYFENIEEGFDTISASKKKINVK